MVVLLCRYCLSLSLMKLIQNGLSENYLPVKDLVVAIKKNKLFVSEPEGDEVENLQKDLDKVHVTGKKKKKPKKGRK